jgi:glutathione peroxidase
MNNLLLIISLSLFSTSFVRAESCPDLLNYKMTKLRSSEQLDFCQAFQGKVVLVVNTASNCGYTPQFKGLEALYQKYKDKGLIVVGFPSNDFQQEFDKAEETAKVCYINYGVTFPMMTKGAVTKDGANPFFQKLTNITGQEPAWNFHKYLIARDGATVTAFPSAVTPEQLESNIKSLLGL